MDKVDGFGCADLWISARAGHEQALRDWAALGLDPKRPDKEGVSPLMIAAARGRGKACIALMEMGVDAWSQVRWGHRRFK